MPFPTFLLRAILATLLVMTGTSAIAQTPSVASLSQQLGRAETELRAVDGLLDERVDADDQKALRDRAVAAQQVATDVTEQLREQQTLIDARIAGLGPVTAGVPEPVEIGTQRSVLARQRSSIDAAIKRGGLANVEAEQLIDELDRSRAQEFNERITAKVASPLTPGYWRAIVQALPRDLRRTELFLAQGTRQLRAQWQGSLPWQMVLGVLLGLVLLFPVRVRARQFGQRFLVEGAPGHRVRRSANAMWRVIVGTLAPLLAAIALVQGLRWSGLLPTRWSSVLDAFVMAIGFSAYTAARHSTMIPRPHFARCPGDWRGLRSRASW
jgi:potassium efflux system protein